MTMCPGACRTRAGWEIQNSTKTDRNLFFASKNLLQLEAQLDAGDAGGCFGGLQGARLACSCG
jgi:hypothetical protein